jgi:hypothetical protein
MDKFKFQVSALGASTYTDINMLDEAPDFVKVREADKNINQQRLFLDGSVEVQGADYDLITGFSSNYSQNWIDYRVQELDFGTMTYNTIIEGICNIDSEVNENEKKLKLNDFSNVGDDYDTFNNNLGNEIQIYQQAITTYVINSSLSSYAIDLYSRPNTPYTEQQYRDNFMITDAVNGVVPPTGLRDPGWAYFLYIGTGANNVHQYRTIGLDLKPDDNNANTYNKISLFVHDKNGTTVTGGLSNYWVRLPPLAGTVDTIQVTFSVKALLLIDVINKLVEKIDNTYSFTSSDITYTGHTGSPTLDFTKMHIAQASELNDDFDFNAKLSLEVVTKWLRDTFDLTWYLSGTSFKLIHRTQFANTATLDLSSETENLKLKLFKESELPTYEIFKFLDSTAKFIISPSAPDSSQFGNFEITYLPDTDQLSGIRNVKINESDLNTDVRLQKSQGGEYDYEGYTLIEAANTGSERAIVKSGNILNNNLRAADLFSYVNKSRYGDDADDTDRNKIGFTPLTEIEPKPLYEIPEINFLPAVRLDLFDMNQEITTALGAANAVELRHNLKGGNATLKVEL